MEKNEKDIIRAKFVSMISQEIQVDEATVNNDFFSGRSGLRLSSAGNNVMKTLYKSYTFSDEIDLYSLPSKHYISISMYFDYPYYIGKKKMVLYSETDSVSLNLHGGIKEFLEALSIGITSKK